MKTIRLGEIIIGRVVLAETGFGPAFGCHFQTNLTKIVSPQADMMDGRWFATTQEAIDLALTLVPIECRPYVKIE